MDCFISVPYDIFFLFNIFFSLFSMQPRQRKFAEIREYLLRAITVNATSLDFGYTPFMQESGERNASHLLSVPSIVFFFYLLFILFLDFINSLFILYQFSIYSLFILLYLFFMIVRRSECDDDQQD